ncbi:SLAP domain-containing protein [Alkalihalobacillus sp. R86527]|uniref:SLAP domain-containing protein n=1 Tax=Alkalihalobacillus sp. R86527 TaxID=3093863 RepID=UPI00366ED361
MTLRFEDKWEKAISPSDHEEFNKVHQRFPIKSNELLFAPVRVAMNHNGALLATVLILNGYKSNWRLYERAIQYVESTDIVAEGSFTRESLEIPSQSAVPWTFIFPSSSFLRAPSFQDWKITQQKP